MSNFVSLVRTSQIKQPTQRSFTLDKWQNKFSQIISPIDEEIKLFESGKWASEKFEIIREKLKLFEFSDISSETLLRILVSITNRSPHILSYASLPISKESILFAEQPIQSRLGQINKVSPNATPDMVLTSSIDSLRFPLRVASSSKKNTQQIISDEEILRKINGAMILGQFYDHIDNYWMRCLWNDYFIDLTEGAELIVSPNTEFSCIEAVSEYRRQVLSAELIFHFQSIWVNFDKTIRENFCKSVPNVIIKGSGKKKKYEIRPCKITDEDKAKRIVINRIISDKGFYTPFFEQVLPNLPETTINDLLKVWEIFQSLAQAQLEKLPTPNRQAELKTVKDINVYSPILYFDQLNEIIKKWSGFSDKKIDRILDFFTFSSAITAELWTDPIIKLNEKQFIILWTPLLYGNLERTIELWLKKSDYDFAVNGYIFEQYARQELTASLSESADLEDVEVYPESFFLKNGRGDEEEIDLILRIGNTILVGEIKCIVFPSEPIEKHRYFEILKKAVGQAQRKVNFVKDNENEFRRAVNVSGKDFKFYPFVLINQPFGSGLIIEGTPIVDLLILQLFFANQWDQLVMFDGKNVPNPTNTVKFYNSEIEAAQKIYEYLKNPPQLKHYFKSLKDELFCIPALDKNSKNICLKTQSVSLPLPSMNYEIGNNLQR